MKETLKVLLSSSLNESIKPELEELLSVIERETFAVSAGGFLSLTKEYLTTVRQIVSLDGVVTRILMDWSLQVFGLVLTYFLLIYQTRDNKGDMRELLKL